MSPSKLVPGSRIGSFPYQIVNAIGDAQGNMSEVYLASVGGAGGSPDASLVVLKIARTGDSHNEFYRQSMDNEVERLRRLKHPGIVRIYPIQREGGIPNLPYTAEAGGLPDRPWFSVLEHLPGGSLFDMINAGPMDVGMSLEIARTLASTLDYLHSRKQVHLDLKPDNILFRTPPQPGQLTEPVLIDFGIARDIGQTGLEARTLQYASPERIQDTRQAERAPEMAARPHPAMDVYALGVILYEMLTGRLPFGGRTRGSLTSEIVKATPPPPSKFRQEVNPDLDNLVLNLMDKDPQKRPTALQAAVLLEEIAIKGGYQPRYPSRSSNNTFVVPFRARSRRSFMAAILALLVLLQFVLILGTYRYWRMEMPLAADSLNVLAANLQLFFQADVLPWFTWLGGWFQQLWSNLVDLIGNVTGGA
jgi:serine/threonine protein kinase